MQALSWQSSFVSHPCRCSWVATVAEQWFAACHTKAEIQAGLYTSTQVNTFESLGSLSKPDWWGNDFKSSVIILSDWKSFKMCLRSVSFIDNHFQRLNKSHQENFKWQNSVWIHKQSAVLKGRKHKQYKPCFVYFYGLINVTHNLVRL